MTTFRRIAIALSILLVLVLGLYLGVSHHHFSPKLLLAGWSMLSLLAGVTVSYINPTALAPTAAQMLPLSRVTALVNFADGDTTALITHNMNIPLASTPTQHGQNSGSPIVVMTLSVGSLTTVAPVIAFTRGTNTITLTKASVVGSNCTVEVNIERFEPIL